jgi:hypothetical protein
MDTIFTPEQEVFLDENNLISEFYLNPESYDPNAEIQVKKIELTENFTRIDFLYTAPDYYDNGGWVNIAKETFIRPVGSNEEYRLVYTSNIPFAPLKHYFNRCGESLVYTLIFPALPKNTLAIDIIEKEGLPNYFNFYNVDFSEWITIMHPNTPTS